MNIEFSHTKKFNKSYKKHHHTMLAISAIKKGKVIIEFNNKNEILMPNSLAIFNPYENHKTINANNNTTDYYTLYCDYNLAIEIQRRSFETEDFLDINKHIIKNKLLYKDFLSLYSKKNKEEVLLFLSTIFKIYCKLQSPKELFQRDSKALLKIKTFLENSDYKTLTINNIAENANINLNYLIKLFKKEYGLSPHAYIINRKINESKKLLKQNIPITEVALELGFFDQSHFHKAFKSVYSITPKEYQHMYYPYNKQKS